MMNLVATPEYKSAWQMLLIKFLNITKLLVEQQRSILTKCHDKT